MNGSWQTSDRGRCARGRGPYRAMDRAGEGWFDRQGVAVVALASQLLMMGVVGELIEEEGGDVSSNHAVPILSPPR